MMTDNTLEYIYYDGLSHDWTDNLEYLLYSIAEERNDEEWPILVTLQRAEKKVCGIAPFIQADVSIDDISERIFETCGEEAAASFDKVVEMDNIVKNTLVSTIDNILKENGIELFLPMNTQEVEYAVYEDGGDIAYVEAHKF